MERGAFHFNVTSIMNKTEGFDFFCVKLFVGPLVWSIVCVPCACVGIPTSVLVLWVLNQRKCSGLTQNIYMLNLTIMDLIANIFKLPSLLNFFVWQDFLTFKLTYIVESFNVSGRPLLMACICVDCYMAVVYPILYMNLKQSKHRMVVCALVWFFTIVYNLLYTFCTDLVGILVWVVPCLLSVSTITFCDLAILHALRKPDPSGRSAVHPQKQRALQTITNSFIMTIVSYLPVLVVHIFKDILPLGLEEWLCSVFIPSTIFPVLGSVILPLLYLENLGILKSSFCVRSV